MLGDSRSATQARNLVSFVWRGSGEVGRVYSCRVDRCSFLREIQRGRFLITEGSVVL